MVPTTTKNTTVGKIDSKGTKKDEDIATGKVVPTTAENDGQEDNFQWS